MWKDLFSCVKNEESQKAMGPVNKPVRPCNHFRKKEKKIAACLFVPSMVSTNPSCVKVLQCDPLKTQKRLNQSHLTNKGLFLMLS